ncbi:MAG: aldo/keto reductase [Betaproteobacteria bacterium]|nr:aldo/keto reductase [Betaproteobacteria bacterium]
MSNAFKQNPLGNTRLMVPEVCMGSMTWGQQNDETQAHAQLDYGLSRGVNFIDTAEMYPVPPSGETYTKTETIVGSWLKKQQREKIILATKVAGYSRGMAWVRGGQDATAASIKQAVDLSLQRLQTDYIDLYQLHWPSRNVPVFGQLEFDPKKEREAAPIAEQLGAFADLVKAGKIRHFGVSNESPWGLTQWINEAEKLGLPRIASVQNAYSLVHRTFDEGSLEVCFREKIALLAYSPLAFGQLSGKYADDPNAAGRLNLFDKAWSPRWRRPRVVEAARDYAKLARDNGMSPAAMAIAWCKSRWVVTSTIIGTTSVEQMKENLDAFSLTLSPELLQQIDAIHVRNANPGT